MISAKADHISEIFQYDDDDVRPSICDTEALSDTTQMLLLDMREEEEYLLSHIKGALNYPGPNISRDKWIP